MVANQLAMPQHQGFEAREVSDVAMSQLNDSGTHLLPITAWQDFLISTPVIFALMFQIDYLGCFLASIGFLVWFPNYRQLMRHFSNYLCKVPRNAGTEYRT